MGLIAEYGYWTRPAQPPVYAAADGSLAGDTNATGTYTVSDNGSLSGPGLPLSTGTPHGSAGSLMSMGSSSLRSPHVEPATPPPTPHLAAVGAPRVSVDTLDLTRTLTPLASHGDGCGAVGGAVGGDGDGADGVVETEERLSMPHGNDPCVHREVEVRSSPAYSHHGILTGPVVADRADAGVGVNDADVDGRSGADGHGNDQSAVDLNGSLEGSETLEAAAVILETVVREAGSVQNSVDDSGGFYVEASAEGSSDGSWYFGRETLPIAGGHGAAGAAAAAGEASQAAGATDAGTGTGAKEAHNDGGLVQSADDISAFGLTAAALDIASGGPVANDSVANGSVATDGSGRPPGGEADFANPGVPCPFKHQPPSPWRRFERGGIIDITWKDEVLPILEDFTRRTPGSVLEVKESCLTWHFRDTDEDFGEMQANNLQLHFDQMLRNHQVRVVTASEPTNKYMVILPSRVHKGRALTELLDREKNLGTEGFDLILTCSSDEGSILHRHATVSRSHPSKRSNLPSPSNLSIYPPLSTPPKSIYLVDPVSPTPSNPFIPSNPPRHLAISPPQHSAALPPCHPATLPSHRVQTCSTL